jgi:hypothetical protein
MSNKIVSIFLSVIFLLFIVTPTIILMVDDSIDISMAFSSSEEEKENEKILDIEVLFNNLKTDDSDLVFALSENNLGYYHKNYPKPHLNLISPPPEQNIL